jgi:hypothetical protein
LIFVCWKLCPHCGGVRGDGTFERWGLSGGL